MSNASTASRAAGRKPAAPDPTAEPELPFDHPERLVAALFETDSPSAWKVPLHLGNRLPHVRFGACVSQDRLVITCTMPMLPATSAEQSRFRVPPGVPTCEITIDAVALQTAISACLTAGVPCDALDGVTRLVGRRGRRWPSRPDVRRFIGAAAW